MKYEMIKKADVMRIINAENAVVLNNLKERSTDEVLCAIASQINGLQTTAKYATDSTDSAKFCDCCDWIPCSDRLPEMFVSVLIVYLSYKGDKNITIAYMDDEENSCDWCSDWNGDVIDAKVTHWMPLTEPPESEVTDNEKR